MRKSLYFIFALLFALVLVSCPLNTGDGNGDDGKKSDDGDDKNKDAKKPALTLDPRLVGGKWYQIIVIKENSKYDLIYNYGPNSRVHLYSDCYYEFTNEGDKFFFSSDSLRIKSIYQNGEMESDTEVYSKDGTVYWKHNNKKLMSYEFHNEYPYPAAIPYPDVNNAVAASGGLITYLLYQYPIDEPYDTDTGINGWRSLLRAHELKLN
jgi:hypothetical protein